MASTWNDHQASLNDVSNHSAVPGELRNFSVRLPSGERWIPAIKFDGCRVQLHLADEDITVFTRPRAWTEPNAAEKIAGEVVVPASDGTTDFSVRVL